MALITIDPYSDAIKKVKAQAAKATDPLNFASLAEPAQPPPYYLAAPGAPSQPAPAPQLTAAAAQNYANFDAAQARAREPLNLASLATQPTQPTQPMDVATLQRQAARVPAAPGLIEPGNIDLVHRPIVRNADNSISTIRSITVEQDGRYYVIPTVVNGQVVSNETAINYWQQTGQHLGTFNSQNAADQFAQALHEKEAQRYAALDSAPPRNNPPVTAADLTPLALRHAQPAQPQDSFLHRLSGAYNKALEPIGKAGEFAFRGTPTGGLLAFAGENLPGKYGQVAKAAQKEIEQTAGYVGADIGTGGALTPAFVAQGLASVGDTVDQYKNGQIDGKHALINIAAAAPMLLPVIARGSSALADFARSPEGQRITTQLSRETGALRLPGKAAGDTYYHGDNAGQVHEFKLKPDANVVDVTDRIDAETGAKLSAAIRLHAPEAAGEVNVNDFLQRPTAYSYGELTGAFRDDGIKPSVTTQIMRDAGLDGMDFPANTAQSAIQSSTGKPFEGTNQVIWNPEAATSRTMQIDAARFGTGEGSGMHGFGLYTSTNPEIAKFYASHTFDAAGSVTGLRPLAPTKPGLLSRLNSEAAAVRPPGEPLPGEPGFGKAKPAASEPLFKPTPEELAHIENLIEHGDWTTKPGARLGAKSVLRALQRGEEPTGPQVDMLSRVLDSKPITAPEVVAAAPPAEPAIPTRTLRSRPIETNHASTPFATQEGAGAPPVPPVEQTATSGAPRGVPGAEPVPPSIGQQVGLDLGNLPSDVTGEAGHQALQGNSLWHKALEVAGIPRAAQATLDLSAALRQGIVGAIGHPQRYSQAFVAQIKALLSHDFAQSVQDDIISNPLHQMVKGRVDLTELPGAQSSGKLTAREETFQSSILQKIPVVGRLVTASDRAFSTFTNKFRHDLAYDAINRFIRDNGHAPTNAWLDNLGHYVNNLTGRGSTKWLGEHAATANAVAFSPKFTVSRGQLIGDLLRPSQSPEIRALAAKDLGSFVATGVGLLAALKLSGVASVQMDPRSTDFGKYVIGNQHHDFWAGFGPIARLIAQEGSGQKLVQGASGAYVVDRNRADAFLNFLRTKASPPVGFLIDAKTGKDMAGTAVDTQAFKELNLNNPALSRLIPLFLQDAVQMYQHDGAKGVALGGPGAILGETVQSYKQSAAALYDARNAAAKADGYDSYEAAAKTLGGPAAAAKYAATPDVQAAQSALDANPSPFSKAIALTNPDQQANDAALQSGKIDGQGWRDQNKLINANKARGIVDALAGQGDRKTGDPVLDNYYAIFQKYSSASGIVQDPTALNDALDTYTAGLSDADAAHLDANTGLSGTPTQQRYRTVTKGLAAAGWFDLSKKLYEDGGLTQYAPDVDAFVAKYGKLPPNFNTALGKMRLQLFANLPPNLEQGAVQFGFATSKKQKALAAR